MSSEEVFYSQMSQDVRFKPKKKSKKIFKCTISGEQFCDFFGLTTWNLSNVMCVSWDDILICMSIKKCLMAAIERGSHFNSNL